MSRLPLLLLLAGLSSCASPAPAIEGSHRATAGLGQTVRLAYMELTPLTIVEDSRCPSDVRCIQAGRLRVASWIALPNAGATEETFELGVEGVHCVTLGDVAPAKTAAAPAPPSAYRFVFTYDPGHCRVEAS